jgi:uncharacterized Fe-S cluster-containing radical SAM superfamily protein
VAGISTIDTDRFSSQLRAKAVDVPGRRLRVTNFSGTEQEPDLTEPPNCNGFGRIRHFRRATTPGWPPNPLPIDPACEALGLPTPDLLRSQVFQNAVCNWRCWYCFVPFSLLAADPRYSAWLSAAELIDLYLAQDAPPPVLDLTGGQPDLVPEWVLWTVQELRARDLHRTVYLWSDDNLSNDYFWRFLTDADREVIATYPMYGRVCCFKGFNADSFSFNTCAAPELFPRQFALMKRLLDLDLDLYGYVTLTSPTAGNVASDMARFVDALQELDPMLPLRVVPLEIRAFTPVGPRMTDAAKAAMQNQQVAVARWQAELEARFGTEDRGRPITEVPLRGSRRRHRAGDLR